MRRFEHTSKEAQTVECPVCGAKHTTFVSDPVKPTTEESMCPTCKVKQSK